MNASEAKTKTRKVLAKKSVQRVFPAIQKAVDKGEFSLKLNIAHSIPSGMNSLTEEEFEVLQKEYGYRLEALYDDSGDYHKSDKKYAYNILWE